MIIVWLTACAYVTDAELQRRMDADGDGHLAAQFGGDDCDDNDPGVGPCGGTTRDTGDTSGPLDTATTIGETGDTGTPPLDTGVTPPGDTGVVTETGVPVDTDPIDTGTPIDTGSPIDTGVVPVDHDLDDDGWLDVDDCNDLDPDIHPGAADAPYDGVDSDCDGSPDCDQDGDGFDAEGLGVCTGDDCDDGDDTIYPGAPEDGSIFVDEDCDGNPIL